LPLSMKGGEGLFLCGDCPSFSQYQWLNIMSDFHEIRYRSICFNKICQVSMSYVRISSVTYFTWESKWSSAHTFHISSPNWVKFGIRDHHVMPLSSCELCRIQCSESHDYLRMQKRLPGFSTLFLIWTKFGTWGIYKNLLGDWEFSEN
jgi:hypothetical protein